MKAVTIHKAKSNFSKLISMAETGQVIPIVRGSNEPTAAIVPFKPVKSRLKANKRLSGSLKYKKDLDIIEPLSSDDWGDLA